MAWLGHQTHIPAILGVGIAILLIILGLRSVVLEGYGGGISLNLDGGLSRRPWRASAPAPSNPQPSASLEHAAVRASHSYGHGGQFLLPLPAPAPGPAPPPCPSRSRGHPSVHHQRPKCPNRPSPWLRSYCPSGSWQLDLFIQDDKLEGDQVFLDVGCNLGTDAVSRLSIWGQRHGLTESWRRELERLGSPAGACRQNLPRPHPEASCRKALPPGKKVRVVCVEPLTVNLDVLWRAKRSVIPGDDFEVVAAAASNFEGLVSFRSDGRVGAEALAMEASASGKPQPRHGAKYEQVNVTTVDRLAEERGFTRVDMLHVDAEGFDPLVLAGAKQTLRRTRLVEFEVHTDLNGRPWGVTTLASQVEMLDSLGFDCYWEGMDKALQRITGCWTAANEAGKVMGMSNVVCVRRDDVWSAVLESFNHGI